MKTRFSGLDLFCELRELQKLVNMRVNRIYDVDKKTYLMKLQRPEEKAVLLVESGSRLHTTNSVWPKNDAPSGFTMKLRKHLRNKRLESVTQLGSDRVAILQFGTGEVAHYMIVELYDRGNVILTDHEHVILSVLRPRVADKDHKVMVRETYELPSENEANIKTVPSVNDLSDILGKAEKNASLKSILIPHCQPGPALLEHLLRQKGLTSNKKKKDLNTTGIEEILHQVLIEATKFTNDNDPKGYIVQKQETGPGGSELLANLEFHPYQFKQHEGCPCKEFDTFNGAVDEFFSQLESQKIDMKVAQQEKQALKKLDNIKKDHDQRLQQLEQDQNVDKQRGGLIELNASIVDSALNTIRSAIANQIDWKEIEELVAEAADSGDPVLSRVRNLRLDINHFSMLLSNPYADYSDDDEEEEGEETSLVDLDIDLSAPANARRYFDKKKSAALKEKKTLQSQGVAIKSAERKTKQTLREVAVSATITKARKTYWFEKFFWCISSENYIIIGGRDQQQNEIIVKRYMGPSDLYVHADLHGASSVIIKNPSGKPVPPKTLNEAGHMAVCYSAAWDGRVVTSAWYVESSQVSKSAPTGEYLTTGSFMIRGKKNYLPPSHLVLGFGILFKLGDESLERHKNERKIRTQNDENELDMKDLVIEEEEEIAVEDGEETKEDDVEGEEQNVEMKEEESDEENSKEEEKEENSDIESAFPDTALEMDFSSTSGLQFKAQTSINEVDDKLSFVPQLKPVSQKKVVMKDEEEEEEQQNVGDKGKPKRGKKGKQKKIKEKYKDQDEEEKELRMQLLHQAQKEDGKRAKKKKKEEQMKLVKENKNARQQQKRQQEQMKQGSREQQVNEDDAEDQAVIKVSDEVDMLDSLTGIPHAEDELLFAVPVIGPYNTMTSYKYKMKVTPGTAKKGKAAKTTLNVFLFDKTGTTREKDLLKSLKDQDVSRNLPGKVKISAPQLQKTKAKKS